jgi:Family of unknown function (DUF5372)
LGFVTITHPYHPLRGQPLPVVCVRHGASPDVIVRLPDGSHAAVALSATDYAADFLASHPSAAASHLLDLQGLRQLAQLIDERRRQGRLPNRPC